MSLYTMRLALAKRGVYFNTFLGFSVSIRGLGVGWNWVHGNGESSYTCACIAGYHNPQSITWRWALYYHLPRGWRLYWPNVSRGYRGATLSIPLLGSFCLRWQENMMRAES